jgi:hypothetical protein
MFTPNIWAASRITQPPQPHGGKTDLLDRGAARLSPWMPSTPKSRGESILLLCRIVL